MNKTVYVICEDKTVFPVDSDTLEPLRCGTYDAWAFTQPPQPNMTHADWCLRHRRMEGLT